MQEVNGINGILVAAHELKAPLSVMRQLALSLDFNQTDASDTVTLSAADLGKLAHTKDQLISVSERAIRQVNDLSKIARLKDGLFAMEPVSVRAVCDDITRELRYLYRENHRDISVKYSNKSHLALANRELLRSVIYNFCTNAMHYSEDGSCSELKVRDHSGKIEVSVRDFGPALPTKIWRSLQKGWIEQPTSVAMRPGSSGLGLYIASQFSRYMRAEISAVRHRDGTSFKLLLPVSTQMSIFDDIYYRR